MKQKLLEMVLVTALFYTDEFIFVWSFKTGNGRQNQVLKLCYFDGRVPKLSSWVTLARSGAGVVCHMYINSEIDIALIGLNKSF